jgi:hypothetical protein
MLQKPIHDRKALQVLVSVTKRRLDDCGWHVWTVTLPRRSITGRFVWGTVWRRRDQGRWRYKQYIDRDRHTSAALPPDRTTDWIVQIETRDQMM